MNVMHVLAITTSLYFAFVAFWILKMEDFLETREQDYTEETVQPTREAEESI